MDEVKTTGKEIVITKNGKPISKLAPFKNRPKTRFGTHKKAIQIYGDIISPLEEEWAR